MDDSHMAKNRRQTECGLGMFRPRWIRPLAGIKSFIAVFSILGLLSWSLYTIMVSQISNIEKAFGFSSSETGWMLTTWEFGYIVTVVIGSYFTPRAHIPHAIGYLTIMCGLSGFVAIIPHFTIFSDSYSPEVAGINSSEAAETESLCIIANRSVGMGKLDTADESDVSQRQLSQKAIAFAIFLIAMILQGAAKGPCYPYSSQYVDDNVNKDDTGYYMGIVLSISIFGLLIGYGVGSFVSNLHVSLQATSLLPTDTRFIGAWWLGFLIVSIPTLMISIPMMCFPRHMKMTSATASDTKKPPKRSMAVVVDEVKVAGMTVVDILRSPVYTLCVLAIVFQTNGMSCFLAFEPKYMETQYTIPSWKANIIVGSVSLLTFSAGSLIGGYVTKRWKMTPFQILRLVTILAASSMLLTIVVMFMGCPNHDIQNPYGDSIVNGSLDTSVCDCTNVQFLAICGDNKETYFSPCHAGCRHASTQSFTNCSAIPGGSAVTGLCPSDCNRNMLIAYAVIRFLQSSIESVTALPIFIVFLRSAGEERKALAIAVSSACTTLFAWLPGPSIGGKLVDGTCSIWSVAKTSGIYCSHYNRELLRYHIHALIIGWRALGLVCFALAMLKARHIKKWPGQVDTSQVVPEGVPMVKNDTEPSPDSVPMVENGAMAVKNDSTVFNDVVENSEDKPREY